MTSLKSAHEADHLPTESAGYRKNNYFRDFAQFFKYLFPFLDQQQQPESDEKVQGLSTCLSCVCPCSLQGVGQMAFPSTSNDYYFYELISFYINTSFKCDFFPYLIKMLIEEFVL